METKVILATPKAAEIIRMVKQAASKSPSGVTFFSVRYYTNDKNETSHYLINLGASYERAKIADIEFLRNLDIFDAKYGFMSSKIDLFKAKEELIKSFENPSKARSDGQKDAYEQIVSGLKIHKETGNLHIYGYIRAKKVLIPGEYDSTNSSSLTIAKNEIRKKLRTGKFRQFNIDGFNELKANGSALRVYFKPKAIVI